jgi:hypothetical protein
MDLSDFGLAACPIRFVCRGGDQTWVGWLFVGWMAAVTVAGIVGVGVERRRRRRGT